MINFLTPQQVSDYLKVPVATLYQWRYRGVGPRGRLIGRHLRYRLSDIDAWVDALDDSHSRP